MISLTKIEIDDITKPKDHKPSSHQHSPNNPAMTMEGETVTPHNISWGIRDFAQIFGVTPRTIRFYEDKGLLSPKRAGQSRVFDRLDFLRFEKIMRAKRLGFSLDDIKSVFDVTDGHVTSRKELLRRKDNFEKVIENLQQFQRDIDTLSQDMRQICDVIIDRVQTSPTEALSSETSPTETITIDTPPDDGCSDIYANDQALQNPQNYDDHMIFDLAKAYEAKLAQNLADDFAPEQYQTKPSYHHRARFHVKANINSR